MDEQALQPALDEQGIKNLMEHATDLWWALEVQRRRAAGNLPAGFRIIAGQVLFPEDTPPVVRFNSEVRGIAKMLTKKPVQNGDPVYSNNLEGLLSFELLSEELDNGHITMILAGERWLISFNFLRRRAHCARLISQAKQFLACANFSLEQQANAPCVDNLFSACELGAKVHTILHTLSGANLKKHSAIRSSINAWGRDGNVDEACVKLFNRLSALRPNARYDTANDKMDISSIDIQIVRDELSRLIGVCDKQVA